jgi:hypothetical protein
MSKLISFDIGIKNLAYCIFDIYMISILDWNVIDLSSETENTSIIQEKCNCMLQSKKTCSKPAKYSMDSLFFCEKHAKSSSFLLPSKEFEESSLKKKSVDSLRTFMDQTFLQEKKIHIPNPSKKETKSEMMERILEWKKTKILTSLQKETKLKKRKPLDFIQIGRNLAIHLSKIDLANIEYVVIENQISPIANKMRTIQGMVAQMFILQNVPKIEFVSSSNKLREYLGEKKEKEKDSEKEKVETIQNPDYKQHKKEAIQYTKEWLESGFSNWKTFFDTYPKKQDDLADSFLQGIWYLRKKLGISLEK